MINMLIRSVLLLSLFAVCFSAGVAQAQIRPTDRSFIANPRYDFMVRQASAYMSDNFRFGQFRIYYAQTRQYDPLGDNTLKKLQDLAFRVQYGENENDIRVALSEYQDIVADHMANLRIVAQVLALSREDPRFGNVEFFTWMRDGLISDVMASGTGKSLQDAYDVMSLSEETAIFLQLGLKVLKTQTGQEGYYYYNMHDVEDVLTGKTWTLFVNTTQPMRFLADSLNNAENVYQILRQ